MLPKIKNVSLIIIIFSLLLSSSSPLYAIPSRLHVNGNQIEDPNGNVIVLRGISLPDLGRGRQRTVRRGARATIIPSARSISPSVLTDTCSARVIAIVTSSPTAKAVEPAGGRKTPASPQSRSSPLLRTTAPPGNSDTTMPSVIGRPSMFST